MFFQQSLGHASCLVGDEKTSRDVDVYLQAVRANGLRIAYTAASHGHNDYLSGLAGITPSSCGRSPGSRCASATRRRWAGCAAA